MSERLTIKGGGGLDQATIDELNKPQPATRCDRCHCTHAARPAGSFDRHMAASVQALADEIDRIALERFKALC